MRTSNHANLTSLPDGNLQFSFSYNPGLITALKLEVPYTDRSYNPDKKVWIVMPKHAAKLCSLVAQYMMINIQPPMISKVVPSLETKVLKVEYLGACKDRGNGEVAATGYCDKAWSVIFSLEVLKAWFDPDAKDKPSEAFTLYTVLGLSRKALQDEIKQAYRRLAKQWHPDICKEPDATEQFKKLSNAYNILSNETTRKKYNAGLSLEASLANAPKHSNWTVTIEKVYRAPLRCGWVLAEGTSQLNRFVVNKILGFEDIIDGQGRTMVSSWQQGDDFFTVEWN